LLPFVLAEISQAVKDSVSPGTFTQAQTETGSNSTKKLNKSDSFVCLSAHVQCRLSMNILEHSILKASKHSDFQDCSEEIIP